MQTKTLQTLNSAGIITIESLRKLVFSEKWKTISIGDFIKQEIETALRNN